MIILKLLTPHCYQLAGKEFSVRKSRVGMAIIKVCKAIRHVLLQILTTLCNTNDIIQLFEVKGVPNYGRVIYETHAFSGHVPY